MKKSTILVSFAALCAMASHAQSATDAYQLSQPNFKGTARFMSMGGAFTALGGDMTTLSQNPGGIGIYRSSEINATLDIDFQNTNGETAGSVLNNSQTKAQCNEFGYIGAFYTGNEVMPFFNLGVSYGRVASFNRVYKANFNNLQGSLTNYIAGYTSDGNYSPAELYDDSKSSYNPYQNTNPFIPWSSILAYNSYMINPVGNDNRYVGLWEEGKSTGYGSSDVVEKGYVDEFNVDFGGNVYNTLFWGIGFGITEIDYSSSTYYQEDFQNARIANYSATGTEIGNGGYGLENYKHMWGNGFNFKVGVIVKPINELRLGLAVHTPTYYNLNYEGWAGTDFGYSSGYNNMTSQTDRGYLDEFEYKLRTPWRLMVGAAGVIGGQAILSFDYEYRPFQNMSVRDANGNEYAYINGDIKDYYQSSNIFRIGAEYRLDRSWSIRAGYNHESSPVTARAAENKLPIYTSGADDTETDPSYSFDKTNQYITCGIGYRWKMISFDMAYVYNHRESTYHAYTPNEFTALPPQAKITDNNSHLVMTFGVRF